VGDMRSVPEPSSVGGSPVTGRDPWAGFGARPSGALFAGAGGNGGGDPRDERAVADLVRRLQDRVDGQEALLDRVADLLAYPDDRARMLIEITESSRIRETIAELLGINTGDSTRIELGTKKIAASFDPGQSSEDRLSAVQYAKFHFDQDDRAPFLEGSQPIFLVIDHPKYQHRAAIEGEVLSELRRVCPVPAPQRTRPRKHRKLRLPAVRSQSLRGDRPSSVQGMARCRPTCRAWRDRRWSIGSIGAGTVMD